MGAAKPLLHLFGALPPIRGAQRLGDIVIAVDTSGSIRTKELEQFAGEINAIASEAQTESIRVVYCDAVVQALEEFGPSEPIRLSSKGGGGTDFVPPFNWVETTASSRSASST